MGDNRFIMNEEDDFFSQAAEEKPRRSLTMMIFDGIFSRRSFTYDKLPSEPLRLSVLKLDGSRFEIEVTETATIAEIKQAVEAVFSCMSGEEAENISWEHVWAQFCLSYDGQKLVKETDHLGDYGIEDGDELLFIRHDSNGCNPKENKLKKKASSKQRRSLSRVHCCDIDDDGIDLVDKDIENGKLKHHNNDEDRNEHNVKRFPGFFGGLFRKAVREEQESKPFVRRRPVVYWAALGRLRGFYPFEREGSNPRNLHQETAAT